MSNLFSSIDNIKDYIPDIYDLSRVDSLNDSCNLRIFLDGKNNLPSKIYLDDIELFIQNEDLFFSNGKDLLNINYLFSNNNIFNNNKYEYLKNKFLNLYITIDNNSSHIFISPYENHIERVFNKSSFQYIQIDKFNITNIQLNINTNTNTNTNINICFKRQTVNNLYPFRIILTKINYYKDNLKTISFSESDVYLKINIFMTRLDGIKVNKNKDIEDNLLNKVSECKKIKNIILPLASNKGDLYCEIFHEITLDTRLIYRCYFKKIILSNNEVIDYIKECKQCKKCYFNSKIQENIFSKYNLRCIHQSSGIDGIFYISDLIEQFDKLKYNKFHIENFGYEI